MFLDFWDIRYSLFIKKVTNIVLVWFTLNKLAFLTIYYTEAWYSEITLLSEGTERLLIYFIQQKYKSSIRHTKKN